MATTSFSLGDHWDKFIKKQIGTGRYGSASEVVRDALREMEIRETKLAALRTHLSEGARQADAGLFVDNFSIEKLIEELDDESSVSAP